MYAHSQDRSEQKPIKNFRKSSRGRTQGHSKIFRAPIRRAHRRGHLYGSSAFLLLICSYHIIIIVYLAVMTVKQQGRHCSIYSLPVSTALIDK